MGLNQPIIEDLNDKNFTHFEGEQPDLLDKLLDDVRIDPSEILTPPPVCWQLVNENGDATTIGTLGNFSLIIGKAKSRKTFFISLALSATIKNGLILNRFKGFLSPEKNEVLYFDTEQGKYHAQRAVTRICNMVGISNPGNFNAFRLRKHNPNIRLELIEHAIYSNDKVGFVVIDGIKDLINSINDEAEATMLTSKLLKWTEERNIHIVTVLHQNKSDNNARGHLGTELMNKAETVLSISKSSENKDISIVEAEYCRDKEPEPFAFEIGEDGLPRLTEGWQVKTAKKISDLSPDDLSIIELEGLIAQCFFHNEYLSYSELINQMQLAFHQKMKRSIGRNKTISIITLCKNRRLIVQEKAKSPYTRPVYVDPE